MFLKVLALIYVACFVANAWSNRQKAKEARGINESLRVIVRLLQEEAQ